LDLNKAADWILSQKYGFMCGIIGYVGKKAASPILLEGLRRLEYRGYDSAGIAVLQEGGFARAQKAGEN
jgi:glucosamine--fructose-6-phosphate aminotransferase (isomerizing)